MMKRLISIVLITILVISQSNGISAKENVNT